jgi:hypothetical protein
MRPVLLISPLIRYGVVCLRTIWLNGIRLKRGFGFDALAASPIGLSRLSFVRDGGLSVGGDHATIFAPSLRVRPLNNVGDVGESTRFQKRRLQPALYL